MINIGNVEIFGWEAALRGMRNPMNSWSKGDSSFKKRYTDDWNEMGPNDHDLAFKLSNAGTDHRKYMRMISVYADITAPLYWWKEYDTYKVGTVANSCSTMHKIADKEFTLGDFSHEHLSRDGVEILDELIENLNSVRELYVNFEEYTAQGVVDAELREKKDAWWQMIQLLPSSYNQKRTVMLDYEVLRNQYHARKNHRLDEWRRYCGWIETLPYSELITGEPADWA